MTSRSPAASTGSSVREPRAASFSRSTVGGLAPAGADPRRLAALAELLGRVGLELPQESVPISRFKAQYGEALQRVKEGQPQILTQGRSRYFIIDEQQLLDLLSSAQDSTTLAEALRGLPSAPSGGAVPRAYALPESLPGARLPR